MQPTKPHMLSAQKYFHPFHSVFLSSLGLPNAPQDFYPLACLRLCLSCFIKEEKTGRSEPRRDHGCSENVTSIPNKQTPQKLSRSLVDIPDVSPYRNSAFSAVRYCLLTVRSTVSIRSRPPGLESLTNVRNKPRRSGHRSSEDVLAASSTTARNADPPDHGVVSFLVSQQICQLS